MRNDNDPDGLDTDTFLGLLEGLGPDEWRALTTEAEPPVLGFLSPAYHRRQRALRRLEQGDLDSAVEAIARKVAAASHRGVVPRDDHNIALGATVSACLAIEFRQQLSRGEAKALLGPFTELLRSRGMWGA